MKTFFRLLSLLLAVLMITALGVIFVSCDDSGSGTGTGLTMEGYDENGLEMDKLGAGHNYGGEMVYVLAWGEGYQNEREFEVEGISGNSVDDAVVQRNTQIEGRLNVELDFTFTPGSNPYRNQFTKYVEAAYNSQGKQPIDVIATYTRTAGMLAQRGFLKDIAKLPLTPEQNWFSFDDKGADGKLLPNMPWWPSQFMSELSFGDSTYFVTGDISTSVPYMMTCIFVNKGLFNSLYNADARDLGHEDGMDMLYDLVTSKNWTLAKLIEFSDCYQDQGATGKNVQDRFGFATLLTHVDAFYTGSELRLVDTDPVEMLVISKDFGSKKAVTLIDTLGEFFQADCNYSERWNYELDPKLSEGHNVPFTEGRCLFLMGRNYLAESVLAKKVNFSYGILPVPMYKTATYKQNNYYTCMGNPVSLYGIFVNSYFASRSGEEHSNEAEHISMLTAVLECWASEGYRRTTPEIFYVNMMTKYADSPDDAAMFQYVRNGITFDLGRIFADALSTMSELPSHCAMGGSSWSISYNQYKSKLNSQMEDLVEAFVQQGTNAQ